MSCEFKHFKKNLTIGTGGYVFRHYQNGSGLPSEYRQLEYIQFSGTQTIETNYAPTLNTSFEVGVTMLTNNGLIIVGYFENDNNDFRFFNAYGNAYFDMGAKRILKGAMCLPNEYHTFKCGNLYVDRDDVRILSSTSPLTSFVAIGTIKILPAYNLARGQIYYCKIYENDVIVRDFIPAIRNGDSEVGLYDLVGNMFYTNSGTGTFAYGDLTTS